MNSKRGKIFFVLPIVILIFSGCDDFGSSQNEIVEPGEKITVSGKLVFNFGYGTDAKVVIQDETALVDQYGNFTVPNVTLPYDLKLFSLDGREAKVFYGLSRSNIVINASTDFINGHNSKNAEIITHFDFPLAANQIVKSYFIPDENTEKLYVVSFHPTNTPWVSTHLQWLHSNSISGKLLLLINTSENGKVLSFDKYYEKKYTVLADKDINDTVEMSDPYFDPEEILVSGQLVNNQYPNTTVEMRFIHKNSEQHSSNEIVQFQHTQAGFEFLMPKFLPAEFTYNIQSAGWGLPFSFRQQIISSGLQNVILDLDPPLELFTPHEYQNLSVYNTEFSWNNGSLEDGIYEVQIFFTQNQAKILKIYTTSLKTFIPDLRQYGFSPENNQTIKWYAKKILGFKNLDEFLEENYYRSNSYEGYNRSLERIATIN